MLSNVLHQDLTLIQELKRNHASHYDTFPLARAALGLLNWLAEKDAPKRFPRRDRQCTDTSSAHAQIHTAATDVLAAALPRQSCG
jgi:hypothetical protein